MESIHRLGYVRRSVLKLVLAVVYLRLQSVELHVPAVSSTIAAALAATQPTAALAAALAACAMHGRLHGSRDTGRRPGGVRRHVGREPMLSAR